MTLNYLPEILKSWRIISKRKYYPLEKFQVVGENRHFLSAQVYHIVSLIKLGTTLSGGIKKNKRGFWRISRLADTETEARK